MKVQLSKNMDSIVITLPVKVEPSKSGKTMLVATSHGGKVTDIQIDGKPVTVSVNAYMPL